MFCLFISTTGTGPWPADSGENGRFGQRPTYVAWPPREPDALTDPLPTSVTLQAGAPSPALLKGCRKAPAMLVGINPNLKTFASGLRALPAADDAPANGATTSIDASIRTVRPTGHDVPSYMAHHRRLKTNPVLMQMASSDFEQQCLDKSKHRRWRISQQTGRLCRTSRARCSRHAGLGPLQHARILHPFTSLWLCCKPPYTNGSRTPWHASVKQQLLRQPRPRACQRP